MSSLSNTFLGTNPAGISETVSSMVELVPFCAQKEEEKSRWLQGWVSCLATAQCCRGPLYKGSGHRTRTGYAEESTVRREYHDMPNPYEKMVWARLEIGSSTPISIIYIPDIQDSSQMENLLSSDLK